MLAKHINYYIVACFWVLSFSGFAQDEYRAYFGDNYTRAEKILEDHKELVDTTFTTKERSFKCALVFPEFIRYNYFKNLIELTSLKLGYVKYGSAFVDFSVGYCQMKPSFAEEIENIIKSDSAVYKHYYWLTKYTSIDSVSIRKERIIRLEQFGYQLQYLNAFYAIADDKYKEYNWSGTEEKLAFFATLYNTGIQASEKTIRENLHRKLYPFGVKLKSNPFTYSEVALSFYKAYNNY